MVTIEKKYCVIVPAFQERAHIASVVADIRKHCDGVVLVVDDGSDDDTVTVAEKSGAVVLKHDVNRGKGAALETGFKYAIDNGFDFVITMDADGQHDPAEIPLFIEEYLKSGVSVIVGNRMGHPDSMPFVRMQTNRFMSWLLSREMGQFVPDTQSGYRLYSCEVLPMVTSKSARFAAESEVLLNLAKAGVKMGAVPIKVIYRDEKSKINPVVDTVRFIKMLNRYRERRGVDPASSEDYAEASRSQDSD